MDYLTIMYILQRLQSQIRCDDDYTWFQGTNTLHAGWVWGKSEPYLCLQTSTSHIKIPANLLGGWTKFIFPKSTKNLKVQTLILHRCCGFLGCCTL